MEQEKIIAYKGFDENFKCRGFHYKVGKEYEEKVAKCCNRGFHACENPMDVWNYYGVSNSRFAIVEQSGKIDKQDNKTCSSRIRIKAELKLAEFIKLCVDSLIEKCKVISNNNLTDNGGDDAQIGSSGNYARIGSSGYNARIESEGQNAVIMCAGNQSKARAKKGSWITLAEYDSDNKPICVKTEQVDGERIKEDTWYSLVNGEFKEIEL